MEHPEKVAACPLFFRANGGEFNSLGLPILSGSVLFGSEVDLLDQNNPIAVPLLCDTPFDCATCTLMQEWIRWEEAQGWQVDWECRFCLSDSWKYERDNPTIERMVPGFYQSGRLRSREPDDPDFDGDVSPLEGCTQCGHESSFLQLVLRRHKR